MESKSSDPRCFGTFRLFLFGTVVTTFCGQPLQGENFDSRFFSSAAKQRAFVTHIEAIFKSEQDPKNAQRRYQIAKRASAKDPRLDYAMGLVLFKQFEYDKADTRFEQAMANQHAVYLPAWQATIVMHLMQSNREEFLRDSVKLAKLTTDPNVEWVGEDRPQAAAAWLGEIDAFIELPKVEFLEPDAITQFTQQIQAAISPSHLLYWTLGKQKFLRKYEDFQQEIEQQQQEVKNQIENTSDKRTTALETRRKAIEQEKEATQRSTVEWKAWYDKQMDQTKKQLDVLRRDYTVLESVAKRLSKIILETQFEMGQLQTVVNLERRPRSGNQLSANQIAMEEHRNQLFRFQLQYAALEQRGFQIMVRARQVMLARQTAARKFQQATGQILQRDQMLTRWQNTVQKSTLKAVAKANDADPIQALEKRLTAATSYFPIDFERE